MVSKLRNNETYTGNNSEYHKVAFVNADEHQVVIALYEGEPIERNCITMVEVLPLRKVFRNLKFKDITVKSSSDKIAVGVY